MTLRNRSSLSRLPIVAVAMASMVYGVWLGLVRLGWALPLPRFDQLILHGPLMIGGFIGTLIGLERAVGLGPWWAYAGPVLTAVGSLLLVGSLSPSVGALCLTAGSSAVVVVYAVVLRRHPSMPAAAMMCGAIAWTIGNAHWLSGASISRVVFWWVAFLVLTIAAERLELTRFLAPSRAVRAVFVAALAMLVAGVAMAVRWPDAGVRVAGAGLLAISVWLMRHDMARRAIRQPGQTRFIAVCLLSGYVWLGGAGLLAIATAAASPGPSYDALLHAIFLGFTVSMVFGHAPIVFPAVLNQRMTFRWTSYVPLVVLHLSVAIRVTGDLIDELGRLRGWGGALNAAALALFVLNTAASVALKSRPQPHP